MRDGTIQRTDEVLELALPEPSERDPLLGHLNPDLRQQVRDRFRTAIERIYIPPPTDCASEYILGHVRGESRDRLFALLAYAREQGISEVRARAKRLSEAKQEFPKMPCGDVIEFGNLPEEVEKISADLADVGEQISEVSRQLGSNENEVKKRNSELQVVSAAIGNLQEAVAKHGPEQKRIAVAERVRLSDFA